MTTMLATNAPARPVAGAGDAVARGTVSRQWRGRATGEGVNEMAEFFIAPELDWIPEETDMGPYLKAFGYDYKFVTYFEVIYDGKPMDGEDFCELYSENPSELDKLAMPPQTDSEGYRLAMFVDSEDGLCGLYVKPVSGAALLLEERRQRIRAINSR